MKKIVLILMLVLIVVVVLFCVKKNEPIQPPPTPIQEKNQVLSQPAKTNLVEIVSNAFPAAMLQSTNAVQATEPINALTATNLDQWKVAIKGLKPLGGFKFTQEWLVETPGRKAGIPITLNQGGKSVQYSAVLISVSAENGSGNVRETQMQTANMNIEETRNLGLQLCDMLGIDPKGFLAWCDKVGNRWMDQPLFGDGDGHHYSFHLLQTFNNEKPWSINFMITPNP